MEIIPSGTEANLSESQQALYDKIYSKITSRYKSADLEKLESSDIAKNILKDHIKKYILTGTLPTNFSVNYNTHSGINNEVFYDTSIPEELLINPVVSTTDPVVPN